MTFLVTAIGHELDLLNPDPANINHFDAAWSLAQINRFGGHAQRPYSVAEHSLLVADIMLHDMGIECPHALLAGLLHDAHEAFMGADMPTPHKAEIQGWAEYEHRWQMIVRNKWGVIGAFDANEDAIRLADRIALATERRDLLNLRHGASPWPVLAGVLPTSLVDLRSRARKQKSWEHWRDDWLDRFHDLQQQRSAAIGREYVPEEF